MGSQLIMEKLIIILRPIFYAITDKFQLGEITEKGKENKISDGFSQIN